MTNLKFLVIFKTKLRVEYNLEKFGRNEKTGMKFTHHWSYKMKCKNNAVLTSLKFLLHPSFEKPITTLSKPPYELSMKAYSSFSMNICIYVGRSESVKSVDIDLNCNPISFTKGILIIPVKVPISEYSRMLDAKCVPIFDDEHLADNVEKLTELLNDEFENFHQQMYYNAYVKAIETINVKERRMSNISMSPPTSNKINSKSKHSEKNSLKKSKMKADLCRKIFDEDSEDNEIDDVRHYKADKDNNNDDDDDFATSNLLKKPNKEISSICNSKSTSPNFGAHYANLPKIPKVSSKSKQNGLALADLNMPKVSNSSQNSCKKRSKQKIRDDDDNYNNNNNNNYDATANNRMNRKSSVNLSGFENNNEFENDAKRNRFPKFEENTICRKVPQLREHESNHHQLSGKPLESSFNEYRMANKDRDPYSMSSFRSSGISDKERAYMKSQEASDKLSKPYSGDCVSDGKVKSELNISNNINNVHQDQHQLQPKYNDDTRESYDKKKKKKTKKKQLYHNVDETISKNSLENGTISPTNYSVQKKQLPVSNTGNGTPAENMDVNNQQQQQNNNKDSQTKHITNHQHHRKSFLKHYIPTSLEPEGYERFQKTLVEAYNDREPGIVFDFETKVLDTNITEISESLYNTLIDILESSKRIQ